MNDTTVQPSLTPDAQVYLQLGTACKQVEQAIQSALMVRDERQSGLLLIETIIRTDVLCTTAQDLLGWSINDRIHAMGATVEGVAAELGLPIADLLALTAREGARLNPELM